MIRSRQSCRVRTARLSYAASIGALVNDLEPHSVLYFGDTRDHWWNSDFSALIAARTGLGVRREVLDVGTGFGHFARTILPHLPRGAVLTGLDPERASIAEAEERTRRFARCAGLEVELRFVEGRVEALPFPAEVFDAVVAQTLLIHVRDI